VRDSDLVSFFFRWKSSFPSTICWRSHLFSNPYFGHLYQKSDGCSCVSLCQGLIFYSIDLHVYFCAGILLFLLLWLCSIIWRQILWYPQHCCFGSGLLWQFKVFCAPICTLRFYLSKDCHWNFDKDCIEHMDYFQYHSHFHNIDSASPWAWHVLHLLMSSLISFFLLVIFIV
jgi:hypothetical protein